MNISLTVSEGGLAANARPTRAPRAALAGLAGLVTLTMGCQPGLRVAGPPIVRIITLYEASPWLNLDAAQDGRPEGFSFVLYLFPENASRAVHRDGMLKVEIYRRTRTGEGDTRRDLVDTWTYSTDELHKSNTPNQHWGHFYLVRIAWPPYDLSGQQIEVETRFEDRAGRTARAMSKQMLVPLRAF